jgi:hypothetical protein
LAAKVTDCKIPRGRPCPIKITFKPDGSVSTAAALAPYRGTPQGACVARHFREAHAAPFTGRAEPFVYTFTATLDAGSGR